MRPFEVLFFAVVFVALIASFPFKQQRPRLTLGLWVSSAVVGVLGVIVEKPRWQLYPAYVVVLLFGAATFFVSRRQGNNNATPKQRRWPRILAVVDCMLTVGLSATLAALLPVFSFDSPTGPFAVGTTSYEWLDANRTDEHPTTPSGHRRLVIKTWYPTAPSNTPYEPYFDAQHAEGLAQALKMPGFVLSHLPLVHTHAHRDVPLAPGSNRFPVILFSHGYPLPMETGTFAAEELASHGYIVFAINHTYDTAFVTFRDGTSAHFESSGDVARIDKVEKILGPRLQVWIDDARFVFNKITKLDAEDARLKGRMDLEHKGQPSPLLNGATLDSPGASTSP